MLKIVPTATMRTIEAAADAGGLSYDTMMQNAGWATAERALQVLAHLPDARVTVLVGPGNNGGDGLVAGRFISQQQSSIQVRFYLLAGRDAEDANFQAVQQLGLLLVHADDDRDGRVLRNMIASSDMVIDALFGIGVRLPLRSGAAKLLRGVNRALKEQRDSRPENISINPALPRQVPRPPRIYVLAVDCPSGLDCDSGQIDANAITADETITFIAAKPGLFRFPGAASVGALTVSQIGVPDDLSELAAAKTTLADAEWAASLLPPRPPDANKGTFGRALITAGSSQYTGAAALAAEAAYRSGAGLVTVAAPAPVAAALSARLYEPIWLPLPHSAGSLTGEALPALAASLPRSSAALVGPGLSTSRETGEFLAGLFSQAAGGQYLLPPLVVDADALNLLSKMPYWWSLLPPDTIITPHPGEMARLTGLTTQEVQADRVTLAQQKAAEWKVTVLLKGAHTVVAAPDGRTTLLPFKTDALATAGSGDVLAGVIAGLLAQGVQPFEAAAAGAYIHGLAGQHAAERNTRSVIAGDIVASIAAALAQLTG